MFNKVLLIYILFSFSNSYSLMLDTDAISCIHPTPVQWNSCNISVGNIQPQIDLPVINLAYSITFTYDSPKPIYFNIGFQTSDMPIDKYLSINTSSKQQKLEIEGMPKLVLTGEYSSFSRGSYLGRKPIFIIHNIDYDYSKGTIEIAKSDICSIIKYTDWQNNISIIDVFFKSILQDISQNIPRELLLKKLNILKNNFMKQLWIKDNPELKKSILDILGDNSKENSIIYIISNLSNLDDFSLNINIVNLYSNFSLYLKLLYKGLNTNVLNIRLKYKNFLQENFDFIKSNKALRSNLEWAYRSFQNIDNTAYNQSEYCE